MQRNKSGNYIVPDGYHTNGELRISKKRKLDQDGAEISNEQMQMTANALLSFLDQCKFKLYQTVQNLNGMSKELERVQDQTVILYFNNIFQDVQGAVTDLAECQKKAFSLAQ